ncbi:MAG: redoxin domain-containing protein [Chryseolinea sp.]
MKCGNNRIGRSLYQRNGNGLYPFWTPSAMANAMVAGCSKQKGNIKTLWIDCSLWLLRILASHYIIDMKKFPSIVIAAILIMMGCSKSPSEQSAPGVNDQPDLIITLTDNTTHNIKDLTGKNVVILFQPDCDHCQREATDFQKNLSAFEACAIYFITAAPMDEIIEFSTKYNLNGHSNVHFGFTPAPNILKNYGAISAPSIYIYSDEHKLVKQFNGEIAVKEVMKYI